MPNMTSTMREEVAKKMFEVPVNSPFTLELWDGFGQRFLTLQVDKGSLTLYRPPEEEE